MVAKIDTKITIITPTFNSAKNITNLLNSISSQGYKNLEDIIIDGESTDDTLCIIKKWKSHKVILHSSRDEGVYDAINKGLSFATGEFVGLLISDDVFSSKNSLNTTSQFLRKSGADICYGDLFYLDTKDSSKIYGAEKLGIISFKNSDQAGWHLIQPFT